MRLGAVLTAGLLLALAGAAEDRAVISVNFDEWEWVPVDPSMVSRLKAAKANGESFGITLKGPMWERVKNFYGATGVKADGVKGKAAFLDAGKGSLVMGLDKPFGHLIELGKPYSYTVWLKGKGVFRFRAWEGGVNPATGAEKWLGFPELISVKVDPEWKEFKGVFTLPDLGADGFRATPQKQLRHRGRSWRLHICRRVHHQRGPAVIGRLSVVGCRLSVVGCRLSVVGCRLSVVGCRLSVVGCRLSVVGCRLSVVGCRLSVDTAGWRNCAANKKILNAKCVRATL